MPTIRIAKLDKPHATLPKRYSDGAAGFDLYAAIEKETILFVGDRALIPTGIVIEIPVGYEGQIRPRSGLALNYGITVLNSPGTIDADYRGEVNVVLINHSQSMYTIKPGDRIAQLVIARVIDAQFELVERDELSQTDRGRRGHGSTGR